MAKPAAAAWPRLVAIATEVDLVRQAALALGTCLRRGGNVIMDAGPSIAAPLDADGEFLQGFTGGGLERAPGGLARGITLRRETGTP